MILSSFWARQGHALWFPGSCVLPVGSGSHWEGSRSLLIPVPVHLAILTHFGMSMLQEKPHLLARKLQEELKIWVVAASDGLLVPLAGWEAGQLKGI